MKIINPVKCCEVGTHEHDMNIFEPSGRVISIDVCMFPILKKLWAADIIVMASCCGHGKHAASVGVHPSSHDKMLGLGYKADPENKLWFVLDELEDEL